MNHKDKLDELAEELAVWLPSFTLEVGNFFLCVLATLPGGDRMSDYVDPSDLTLPRLGWFEWSLLSRITNALKTAVDVEYFVDHLLDQGI